MEITVQDYNHCSIMTVSGRIDMRTDEEFESMLVGLVARGKNNLVLDLECVDWLNSGGLKAMLEARKTLKARGGDIVLAQPSDQVVASLDIAGFKPPFYLVYPTREAAIGSF